MSSNDYWRKREEEALKHYIKDEKAYQKEIQRIYSDMLVSCNEQINAFYGRYADKEGITLAEAKKRVSKLDIAEYERKAKRYVKDKDFSDKANEEMRLYNLTMKVNRFEMLKANIGLEMISGHDELEKFMSGILKGRTEEELARQAGILGKTVRNNAQLAHAIPNASFHNAKFSDRIWLYQDLLKADLNKLLQTGLIQGKNPRQLARELKKTFDVSTERAEMLMITELARVQTAAQKQSFERNGFEEYTFHANSGCCGDCQALNGKHFKVKDMMPGENASPIHPRCRCSASAYSDRADYDAWLNYLEQGGTTAEYEKMKAVKNDTDRQAQIRARREAWKKRHAEQNQTTATADFDSMDKKQLETWTSKHLKTQFEDLKGVNVEYFREVVKVINAFENKMGGKTIDGLSVKFGACPKGLDGKYDDKTHTLLLKSRVDLAAYTKKHTEQNMRSLRKLKKPFNPFNTYSGTVWHEIGHAVDMDTGQALSRSLSATRELDEKSVRISVYAGSTQNVRVTKRSEAWAENFAAYMSGENRENVPPEIVEMIEDYFRKKKGN